MPGLAWLKALRISAYKSCLMSKICQFIQLVLLNETGVEFHLDYNGIIDGIIAIKRVKGREILLCTTVLTYTTLYNRACQTNLKLFRFFYIPGQTISIPILMKLQSFCQICHPNLRSISRQEIDFQIT